MERNILIEKAVENIAKLPDQQVQEVANFAEFLLNKSQDQVLVEDIQQIVSESNAFNFLKEEPELYSINDLLLNHSSAGSSASKTQD